MTSPTRAGRTVRRAGLHHTKLVVLLAVLKDHCGLTFAELAARTADLEDTTAVSASTLKRAAAPRTVPQEHVVTAYVRACGATPEDERDALKLWRAARAEDRGILATLQAPSVTSIRTHADLAAALAAAYERAGAPPLRVVQDRATTDEADGALLLPLTTAWRITRREGQGPVNWTQCEAFLRACGINPRRMRPWQEAFTRAHASGQTERAAKAATTPPAPAPRRWDKQKHWTQSAPVSGRFRWVEHLSTTPIGDAARFTSFRPATTGPEARAAADHGDQQQAVTRIFDGLTPADRHSVLAAGLAHLATTHSFTTQARRNGTAPDTGIDAITLHDDGVIHLVEYKRFTDPSAPPGTGSAPSPALPKPPAPGHGPARARRMQQTQPA
ncbi:helix-turn-helix domain-containing protein [Streptomyces sp. NPDC004838]